MTDVLRFHAPGPWLTRDLKECVLARDYDALRLQLADIESQNRVMWDVASDREARLAESARDSQRYRWLVNCNDAGVWAFLAGMDDDQIDVAIDKWMAASETESGTHKQE